MAKRAPQQYHRASDAPTKRGPVPTAAQMELIADAFREAKKDYPHLKAIGYSKLALPPSIKRTAVGKALAELNKGRAVAEIAEKKGSLPGVEREESEGDRDRW